MRNSLVITKRIPSLAFILLLWACGDPPLDYVDLEANAYSCYVNYVYFSNASKNVDSTHFCIQSTNDVAVRQKCYRGSNSGVLDYGCPGGAKKVCKNVLEDGTSYSVYFYDMHVVDVYGACNDLSSSSNMPKSSSSFAISSSSQKTNSVNFSSSREIEFRFSSMGSFDESSSSFNQFNPNLEYGKLTDSRDGQTYKTIVIGSQTWMAENMNYASPASQCYGNETVNCTIYGRLYLQSDAIAICPEGWRLPTGDEARSLLGNKASALLAGDDNSTGFSALLGGSSNGNMGTYAIIWSSMTSYDIRISRSSADFLRAASGELASVRCLKDETSEQIEMSSSSQKIEPSSTVSFCGDLWCGLVDVDGKVKTGGEDYMFGYWFDYSDADKGGNSAIIFPSDIKPSASSDIYSSLINDYQGIKISYILEEGYGYPYAGLAFYIVNDDQRGADITDWGGFCIVYQSTTGFVIRLQEEDEENVTGGNNYQAKFGKSATEIVADYPWSRFKQESG